MKTFEFVEADRKTVLVVDVADDNPIASTLVDLEHLNLTLHAENARLQRLVDMNQKVVEACRKNTHRSPEIAEALRELDEELKCPMHDKPGCACG